ncbi:MAG: polysaccharide biosynthesis protein [Acidobacteriota bacterium]
MSFGGKRFRLLAVDITAVALTSLAANYLRFDQILPSQFVHFQRWLLLDLLLTPVIFYLMGMYRGFWRYASISDLKVLLAAVSTRTLILLALFIFLGFDRGVPRSTTVIQALLLLFAVGGARLTTRMRLERSQRKDMRSKAPVLIIGAGDAGEILLRELRKSSKLPYRPVGFIDDDASKWGRRIHGVAVLDGADEIPRIAARRKVREAILAIPSATGDQVKRIYQSCRTAGVRVKTVPPLSQLLEGRLDPGQIRSVELEDLLGREIVRVDLELIRAGLTGKKVLITGGAGSIGRELARQVAECDPARLIVLDRNENSMYFSEIDLRRRFPAANIDFVVGDILDERRLHEVMEIHAPQIVFHAAAFKHVPMMEHNAVEAFKNNVLGTRNVAEKAAALGVERFLLISTDKAVNPIGVMGGTKRLAELVLQDIPGDTVFVAVRFGNVLGSDGSVVPLFKKQIAEGGPVTVTHPDVTRYFMTVREAVQLVLQAGTMGRGGEVFLLDMGKPVKVVSLARHLIELSGLGPDEDIEIVYTGLRPGEKLHEELHHSRGEEWLCTAHPKILKFHEERVPSGVLRRRLAKIEGALVSSLSPEADQLVREALVDLVPEFGGGARKARPSRPIPAHPPAVPSRVPSPAAQT